MSTTNPPAAELKLGRIKATIWRNESEAGVTHFNANFSRLYRLDSEQREQGDSGWRETSSFGRDDLLLLAKLADKVHDWVCQQQHDEQEQQ